MGNILRHADDLQSTGPHVVCPLHKDVSNLTSCSFIGCYHKQMKAICLLNLTVFSLLSNCSATGYDLLDTVRDSRIADTLYGTVSNQQGHIGVLIEPGTGHIMKVHVGSPAYRCGVLPHDIVVEVDGHPIGKNDIAGDAGTFVSLVIRRGTETLRFTLVRVPVREIDVRR